MIQGEKQSWFQKQNNGLWADISAARQSHGILTLPQHQVGAQKLKKQIKYYEGNREQTSVHHYKPMFCMHFEHCTVLGPLATNTQEGLGKSSDNGQRCGINSVLKQLSKLGCFSLKKLKRK